MGRFRLLGYSLTLIGLFVFWSAIALPFVADHTSLCASCHEPQRAYKTAGISAHREVGCLACHRSPSIGGRIANDLRGVQNLIEVAAGTKHSAKLVDSDACLACHDEIIDDLVQTKTLKMSHREVIKAGWRCGDCHGETGHNLPAIKAALSYPSMDKCFGCHLQSTALRKCDTCHLKEVATKQPTAPASMGTAAHTGDWKTNHGLADSKLCNVCHKPTYCKKCHGVALPHSKESWVYQHGGAAILKKQPCLTCHRQQFCDDCHQTAMPHEASYASKHQSDSTPWKVCQICHIREQCAACHALHQSHKGRGMGTE